MFPSFLAKTEIYAVNRTFKRKKEKNQILISYITLTLISHDEIFTVTVCCPTTSPNKSKMADGGYIEFRSMLISL